MARKHSAKCQGNTQLAKNNFQECFKFLGMAQMFKYMIKSELWSCSGTDDTDVKVSVCVCVYVCVRARARACVYFGKFNRPYRHNRYRGADKSLARPTSRFIFLW